jgi:CRP/FNR family transcriptional regulator, cyclic AMP receptor protein
MDALETFAQEFPQRKYIAGTNFFTDESQPSFFLYLIEGTIQLSRTTDDGTEVILHVFHPGSFLSLLSLVEAGDAYDFTAVSDVTVYQVPRKEFFEEARKNGEFTLTLLTHAMKGMRGLLYRVQQTSSASAYQRVAGLLIYFAKHAKGEDRQENSCIVHITHQHIAEWLGLTRENVTLQLKKLQDSGYIVRHQGEIEVVDVDALQKIG